MTEHDLTDKIASENSTISQTKTPHWVAMDSCLVFARIAWFSSFSALFLRISWINSMLSISILYMKICVCCVQVHNIKHAERKYQNAQSREEKLVSAGGLILSIGYCLSHVAKILAQILREVPAVVVILTNKLIETASKSATWHSIKRFCLLSLSRIKEILQTETFCCVYKNVVLIYQYIEQQKYLMLGLSAFGIIMLSKNLIEYDGTDEHMQFGKESSPFYAIYGSLLLMRITSFILLWNAFDDFLSPNVFKLLFLVESICVVSFCECWIDLSQRGPTTNVCWPDIEYIDTLPLRL